MGDGEWGQDTVARTNVTQRRYLHQRCSSIRIFRRIVVAVEKRRTRISGVEVRDVRFPTSRTLDGSDAMNPAPDYSAAYVVLHTDHPEGLAGHGLAFTIGRGTEIVVAAIKALLPLIHGNTLESLTANMGRFWRMITGDSQLRWIGPEKGAIHLATAALVNAVWDLWAKVEGKPLWKLLADLTPEELIACIDFRYITDALTPKGPPKNKVVKFHLR